MPKFMVRVELHGAQANDYTFLHLMMLSYGFSRKITADDGRVYELPTATYVIERFADVLEVRGWAQSAANATGRGSWVFANEYSTAAWSLKEVPVLNYLPALRR